ncbi:hypothetical protein NHF46_12890 [Arthrobacter alpinus]|nr:hypothetical protein [Arthrobacter alpinus]
MANKNKQVPRHHNKLCGQTLALLNSARTDNDQMFLVYWSFARDLATYALSFFGRQRVEDVNSIESYSGRDLLGVIDKASDSGSGRNEEKP